MSKDFSEIAVENILLLSCSASFNGVRDKHEYSLAITSFSRQISDDGKTLFVNAAFDLMHGVPDPCCTLECTFVAIYSKAADTSVAWEDFSDGVAVAHMIPYVREFMASVTNRMPVVPLIIPPINAFALVEAYHKRPKPVQ